MIASTSPSHLKPEKSPLEELVAHRLGSRIRGFRLLFQQSGLILQGRSNSYHAKQIAQHAVMELSTVPILANEIEVQ